MCRDCCASWRCIANAWGARNSGSAHCTWVAARPRSFRPRELDRLLDGLLQDWMSRQAQTLAVEVDPRVTTREQLAVLRRHGFNRISIGVQDFDPRVLDIVNRAQTDASQVQRRGRCGAHAGLFHTSAST